MGKVREETSTKGGKAEAAKPAPAKQPSRGRFMPFLSNLARTDRYKPSQGKNARLWTAVGLGVVAAAGIYTAYNRYFIDMQRLPSVLWPTGIALVAAWIIWRVLEFPPFVDFLIATEAEMLKVSWTNKDELQRATIVVLMTVLIISLFLAGVDVVWSLLLKMIGVLRFGGEGLGSQEG
jgi:preprotein translocase subunit SecE